LTNLIDFESRKAHGSLPISIFTVVSFVVIELRSGTGCHDWAGTERRIGVTSEPPLLQTDCLTFQYPRRVRPTDAKGRFSVAICLLCGSGVSMCCMFYGATSFNQNLSRSGMSSLWMSCGTCLKVLPRLTKTRSHGSCGIPPSCSTICRRNDRFHQFPTKK
jgi:hypothetical protein